MSDRHLKRIDQARKELSEAIERNGGVECEQTPDLFFPEDYTTEFLEAWGQGDLQYDNARANLTKFAKSICKRCPLKLQCLSVAVVGREEYGIWGGLTSMERRKLWVYSSPSTTPFSD